MPPVLRPQLRAVDAALAAARVLAHERVLEELPVEPTVADGARTVLVQLLRARPAPERLKPPGVVVNAAGGVTLTWAGADEDAARITVRRLGPRLEVWVWAGGRTLLEATLPTARLPADTILLLSAVTHVIREA